MANLTTLYREGLGDQIMLGVAMAAPAKHFIALFTADPTAAAQLVNEVTAAQWPGYARCDVGVLADAWNKLGDGLYRNKARFYFEPNAGAQVVIVTHMGIFEAGAGGRMITSKQLGTSQPDGSFQPAPKRIESGDDLSFHPGTIDFQLS
ncbi:MAG: hypothetical protein RR800_00605 [Comamonas sp.]